MKREKKLKLEPTETNRPHPASNLQLVDALASRTMVTMFSALSSTPTKSSDCIASIPWLKESLANSSQANLIEIKKNTLK